jgi:hypothetical protein
MNDNGQDTVFCWVPVAQLTMVVNSVPYFYYLSTNKIDYQGEININSVEVHPQLRNNGHPVDGVLVGAGSLWPKCLTYLRT